MPVRCASPHASPRTGIRYEWVKAAGRECAGPTLRAGWVHDSDRHGRGARGSITLDGRELVGAPESEMRSIRGRQIGLVPQDPMSNLNPVAKIGTQVAETLLAHGLANRQNV